MRSAKVAKTRLARQLRNNATRAERKLWRYLRSRSLGGFKFVRQEPIGPYVVDFVCRGQRLVIEVDGGQHADNRRDAARDQWLFEHRYRVLRFWNNEVLGNIEGVWNTIFTAASAAAPPHPNPLPASGERESPSRTCKCLFMPDAAASKPISLYIDADACPVKQEIYRVAERHAGKGVALKIFVVSNAPIAVPRDDMIRRVVVGAGMDEADNWIAERAKRGDIVITADVPLASRAVKAGAAAIAPNGKAFTEDSIGNALATRNLLDSLRSAGEITGGPKPFAPRDRSEFLSALDRAIVRLTREGFGQRV